MIIGVLILYFIRKHVTYFMKSIEVISNPFNPIALDLTFYLHRRWCVWVSIHMYINMYMCMCTCIYMFMCMCNHKI